MEEFFRQVCIVLFYFVFVFDLLCFRFVFVLAQFCVVFSCLYVYLYMGIYARYILVSNYQTDMMSFLAFFLLLSIRF